MLSRSSIVKQLEDICNLCSIFKSCKAKLDQDVTLKQIQELLKIQQPFSFPENAPIFNGPGFFRKCFLLTKSILVCGFTDHDFRLKLFSETSGRQKFYITLIKNLSSNSSSIRFSLICNFSLFSFVLYSKFMK